MLLFKAAARLSKCTFAKWTMAEMVQQQYSSHVIKTSSGINSEITNRAQAREQFGTLFFSFPF